MNTWWGRSLTLKTEFICEESVLWMLGPVKAAKSAVSESWFTKREQHRQQLCKFCIFPFPPRRLCPCRNSQSWWRFWEGRQLPAPVTQLYPLNSSHRSWFWWASCFLRDSIYFSAFIALSNKSVMGTVLQYWGLKPWSGLDPIWQSGRWKVWRCCNMPHTPCKLPGLF